MDPLVVSKSPLDRLSDEIWLLVLSQVAESSLSSLAACLPVSKAWYRLCTDNHVWRAAFLGLNGPLGLDDRLHPPSLHDWTATSWYRLVKDQVAFNRIWAPTPPKVQNKPEQGLQEETKAKFGITVIDLVGPVQEQTVVNIRKAAVDSFPSDQLECNTDRMSSSGSGIMAVLADHSLPPNDPHQQRPSVLSLSRVLHFLNLNTLEPFSRLLIPPMPNIPMVPGFVPAHWVQLGHVDAQRRQFSLFLRVGSQKTSMRLYSLDDAVSFGVDSVLDLDVIASHEFPGHVWFGDQPVHPHPTNANRLMLMFTNLFNDLVTVHHLDATTFELVKVVEIHAPMGSRHYDAEFGSLIITTCEYGAVRIWSADTGECLFSFQVAHMAAVDFAIWRPWIRPGLERENTIAGFRHGGSGAGGKRAYLDPKWLQVLSVTMPLAEFGMNAPMGLALHSARSATSLVPAVFVNESTDPDPDSKTNVPGVVWRGKAINPPPAPTPGNPEPVVFPEDIEPAPLPGALATVLRYQARHSRLMAFLSGYQLLFTVDLDGVLNVTDMASGKDLGPLVMATVSASELSEKHKVPLEKVYRGESLMSKTLKFQPNSFPMPRKQDPPITPSRAPTLPLPDAESNPDPHLPPLTQATTSADIIDALINHPHPEQAARTIGAAVLQGVISIAVLESLVSDMPNSGMEHDRLVAILHGMEAAGVQAVAQLGPAPVSSPQEPPLSDTDTHEPVDAATLVQHVMAMAENLASAATLAMTSPALAETAARAVDTVHEARAAVAPLQVLEPPTGGLMAVAATCTRHAAEIILTSGELMAQLVQFLGQQTMAATTAALTGPGTAPVPSAEQLRALVDQTREGVGFIRSIACVNGRGVTRIVRAVLEQQQEEGDATHDSLETGLDQVTHAQLTLDASLDQVIALLSQLAVELQQVSEDSGQAQADAIGGADPLAAMGDNTAPAAVPLILDAPVPPVPPIAGPPQDEPQLLINQEQDDMGMGVGPNMEEAMMMMDAPGGAWDPDQDATYPFGDVMWLDSSWQRILVYRGKSLMVLSREL